DKELLMSEKKIDKDKLEYLDIAKGIGIILVVFGHALTEKYAAASSFWFVLRRAVYFTHMSIFFIISGFLFEYKKDSYSKKGFGQFFTKKATVYLVPYVFFSVLILLILRLASLVGIGGIFDNVNILSSNWLDNLLMIITFEHHPDNHLWFIYVMFVVLMIGFWIKKLPLLPFIILFYLFYAATWFFDFPEVVWKVMRYLFLFQIGRIIRQRDKWIKKANIILLIIVWVIGLIGMLHFSTADNYRFQAVIRPFVEVSGALIVLKISLFLTTYRRAGKAVEVLKKLGQNSYPIYLIHQPYIVPIVLFIIERIGLPIFCNILIATFIGLAVPLLLYKLIIKRCKILNLLVTGNH
ncbi:MAG: acyltransferase, partial [Ruminococcus sp.]|nr:acyltransferase [Ruminococcus sp.]